MTAAAQHLPLLHLIAPRAAHKGLIANNPWLPSAYSQATSLFQDKSLHGPAVVLAAVHEAAIDYLTQAPVLVVAIAAKGDLAISDKRKMIAAQFKVACNARPRLRDLMRHYGLAPQLRALSGDALNRNHHRLLKPLSDIPPSRLAQCIPATVGEQIAWLSAIDNWRTHVLRATSDANWLVTWAAANQCHRHTGFDSVDMIDFAARNRNNFDLDWNFTEAVAASARWHENIAQQSLAATCREEDIDAVADYGALPDVAEVDGYAFAALKTRLQLFEEGRAMHHCVSTYAGRVFSGQSWIYSISQDRQRIATLEVQHAARGFCVGQLRSYCNRTAPTEAARAAARFVAQLNAAFEIVGSAARHVPAIEQQVTRRWQPGRM